MPNELTWRNDWLLGIEQLDEDHRRMVHLLNLLFAAPETPMTGAGPTETGVQTAETIVADARAILLERLDEVIEHLRAHFAREEAFLHSIDFPGYDEHSSEHALQMAEFVQLRREILGQGTDHLDAEIIGGIKRWFFNHVIAEDHRFAAYYFEKILEREEDWNNLRLYATG